MNSKKYYVGYKFELRGDGGLPDYSFSENLTGARDHISKDAKLFNKRLVFDEMIFAFMRENDDFKKELSLENLYAVEDSFRVNSRKVFTSTIIEKMKHTLFENDSYNIVNRKLVLYEDKVLGKRHHFPNEINWKEKTSFEYVDGDIWFKNTRLKYNVLSGRVNIVIQKMPGNRSVSKRMILPTENSPEKDIIDITYYVKKFSSFVRSCLNINNKEAWSFKREFLDSVILTKNIKCDLEENDLDSCADSSCKCAKSKYSFSTMSVPTMKRFLVDGFEYPFDHGVLQRIDLIPKFL
ncbi:1737_t:CDS:2, partial [Gigaspora rosea]